MIHSFVDADDMIMVSSRKKTIIFTHTGNDMQDGAQSLLAIPLSHTRLLRHRRYKLGFSKVHHVVIGILDLGLGFRLGLGRGLFGCVHFGHGTLRWGTGALESSCGGGCEGSGCCHQGEEDAEEEEKSMDHDGCLLWFNDDARL